MKTHHLIIPLGILLGSMTISHATIIGFGQLGGNNATVPADLASRATADGNGFVVTNGATPNITLTWDANWDIHTFNGFADLENLTVGGGDWDNEGGIPRIAQLDVSSHSIAFSADPEYVFVLNSFDLGHQPESAATSEWNLTLTDSNSAVVWSQSVTLDNTDPSTALITITPNFTGAPGESYTLAFEGVTVPFAGRHGIDNLSFNQVAVPEPGAIGLLGLAGGAFLARRRQRR